MSRFAAFFTRGFAGRELNPILVKETRQAVRSRLLLSVICLLLLVLVIASLLFLAFANGPRNTYEPERGVVFFGIVTVILGFAQIAVGATQFFRAFREREPGNVDLLFITTLTPAAIVRGKFVAGLLFSLLMISLGLPFLALSYLLRGIDLVTIGTGVLSLAALGLGVNAWAILVAAYPGSALMKRALFTAPLLLFFFGGFGVLSFAFDSGFGGSGSGTGFQKIIVVASICGVVFSLLWAMYAVAVFLLSPPTANRSLACRLTLTGLILFWLVVGVAFEFLTGKSDYASVPLVLATLLMLAGLLLGLLSGDTLGRRPQRELPRHLPGRLGALFLYNGILPALLWTCAIMCLIGGWLALLRWLEGWNGSAATSVNEWNRVMSFWGLFSGYVLAYALTARWLAAQVHRRKPGWTAISPMVLFLLLPAAGSVGTWLIKALAWPIEQFDQDFVPLLGNMFALFQEDQATLFGVYHLFLLVVWLGLALLVNSSWIRSGLRQFFLEERPTSAEAQKPGIPQNASST